MMRCKICLEHVVNVAFLSCGHTCCSACCDLLLHSCPPSAPSSSSTTDSPMSSSPFSSSNELMIPFNRQSAQLLCDNNVDNDDSDDNK